MAWRVQWNLQCDQCDKRFRGSRDSRQSERRAERKGWLLVNGFYGHFHFCPVCVADADPELWPSQETLEAKNNSATVAKIQWRKAAAT